MCLMIRFSCLSVSIKGKIEQNVHCVCVCVRMWKKRGEGGRERERREMLIIPSMYLTVTVQIAYIVNLQFLNVATCTYMSLYIYNVHVCVARQRSDE